MYIKDACRGTFWEKKSTKKPYLWGASVATIFLWWHNNNYVYKKDTDNLATIGSIPFVRLAIMSTIPDPTYFVSLETLRGWELLERSIHIIGLVYRVLLLLFDLYGIR